MSYPYKALRQGISKAIIKSAGLSAQRYMMLLTGMLVFNSVAAADHDISGLLRKMAEADDRLNYQGTFILRKSDELMSMRVEHGVDERGIWESIEALNGESRRVVRNNDVVMSIYPERKLVTVSQAHNKSTLHPSLPENLDKLSQYYSIKQLDNDRIANRNTAVIDVQPNDNFRYGYRYWIDDLTGVLLRCDLLNESGTVIEQMMFTSMKYTEELPKNAFTEIGNEGYTLRKLDRQRSTAEIDWSVHNLPTGFMLMQSTRREHENSVSMHLVYSDGLASVSVFIEPDSKGYHHLEGASTMGALNAFGTRVDDFYVTVMGEVPASTVTQIAQSTRRGQKTVQIEDD